MKFALCSEVFKTPLEETIRRVAEIGFDGIEIAPFNAAPTVDEVSPGRRRELARVAAGSGLEVVGLHWLLVSPEGLHLTSPDSQVRRRTFDYLVKLVHFCADLAGRLMVLGSPLQRSIPPGADPALARRQAAEGLREAAEAAGSRGVRLLLEPLTPKETNFLNTVEEALELKALIDHPAVGYILDVKAMSAMPEGIEGTLRRHGKAASHFHANEPGGLGPGMGSMDFRPAFKALLASGYQGWASAEPFDYSPDAETVARAALKTMRAAAAAAGGAAGQSRDHPEKGRQS
jgi:sugar phosphate isomerase/epimerase